MTLDEIKKEWTKDVEIDDIELDKASLIVPRLHAKYSGLLSEKQLLLKQYGLKYSSLLKDKWLWYNGKMDEGRIKELGWEPDPFDGLKVMKADMQIWYNADKELQEMNARIEYLKVTVDYLKECLNNVTWRHQTIKNTIEWRKFMSGQ
ncbi:uncharacterized protein METZ01_LOCUS264882 [marine metagenome]|uniref:Uncharacterized protein n=1 Tax=marine metagenome TaxID=408172 RepID=A0A382JJW5_9ZZZZ